MRPEIWQCVMAAKSNKGQLMRISEAINAVLVAHRPRLSPGMRCTARRHIKRSGRRDTHIKSLRVEHQKFMGISGRHERAACV